jgi:uncharacterized membrane protein
VTGDAHKSEGRSSPRGADRAWPQPEWVFLALSLILGGAFLVLTPPFQVPDEEAHFRRSFELSQGHVIPIKDGNYTGDFLPAGLESLWAHFNRMRAHPEEKTSTREIVESRALTLSPSDREFVVFSNTAIHPPLTYLPQALGVFLARQFSSSVLVCFYAGRVFNFLTGITLTFLAIRLTPIAKWAFAALALTPMSLFMTASLSSDVLTNALAFLLVAQIAECAFGPQQRLSTRSLVAIALLGMALGLAKQAYFLLPLAFVLIPVRKLGGGLRYGLGLAGVMTASLLPVLAWGVVVRNVYSPPDLLFGMDPLEQFRRMINNEEDISGLLLRTAQRWRSYGEEYVGFLGWLDTRMPTWLYFVQLALLAAVSAFDRDQAPRLSGRQAALAGGVVLLVGATVLLIMHLTWDPVGTPYIVVQGRYFIPSSPLAAIVLSYPASLFPRARHAVFRFVPVLTLVTVPIVLAAALWQLHDRYYVDSDFAHAERCYQRGELLLKQPDQTDRAYEMFEEAVRIDPDHPGANYRLGIGLRRTSPREAIRHLRASLRREPGHVPTLTELAGILANQLEFDEAIALYQEALRLRPNDATLERRLSEIKAAQRGLADALAAFDRGIQSRLSPALTEQRFVGTPREGIYLKPNRGPVGNDAGGLPLPAPCNWRCPPPSGREIRVGAASSASSASQREPFYACSEQLVGPKRVFLFPPPGRAKLFADEDVSWFFQLPLADLNEEQRQREENYRKEQRLEFPLMKLPN